VSPLRGAVVLVDHAAEDLPALHRRVRRNCGWLVVIGWPLLPGLVRPMPVIVPNVGLEHRPQVGFVVDQHPVGALGPYGAYPTFGVTVRPGRPRRGLHDPYAVAGQDIVERGRELCVAVPDKPGVLSRPTPR
jgi:hypothetical protein